MLEAIQYSIPPKMGQLFMLPFSQSQCPASADTILVVIAKMYKFGGCNPLRLDISQWPALRYPEEMK